MGIFYFYKIHIILHFSHYYLNGNQQANSRTPLKHLMDDISGPLSPKSLPAPKQLKFTTGIVNGLVQDSAAFLDETQKVIIFLLCCFQCRNSPP